MSQWISGFSEPERWFIGIAAVFLAGIVSQWFSQRLSHALALRRERLFQKTSAANTFRATIFPELHALRDLRITEPGQVYDILKAAYTRHEAAYSELHHTLPWLARIRLRRHWMAYRGPYPQLPELQSEDTRYRLYHFIGSNCDDEENKKYLAIVLLTKLIA